MKKLKEGGLPATWRIPYHRKRKNLERNEGRIEEGERRPAAMRTKLGEVSLPLTTDRGPASPGRIGRAAPSGGNERVCCADWRLILHHFRWHEEGEGARRCAVVVDQGPCSRSISDDSNNLPPCALAFFVSIEKVQDESQVGKATRSLLPEGAAREMRPGEAGPPSVVSGRDTSSCFVRLGHQSLGVCRALERISCP